MHRILVVDDEPRHRMGLINMIKGLKPEYVVFEARNGSDALEIAETNKVDIIITDIKMPIMDGLQLIEQLGDHLKKIKVIILSAFGYFEYAQKALSLGAFDYLLKPVDEEKVVKLLRKVEDQIKLEHVEMQEKEIMKKQLNNSLPIYLESLLNKWVKGIISGSELNEIESIFPYKGIGTVLVSEIINFNALINNYSSEETDEIRLNIKYWMKETLNPLGHSISFYLQSEKTILVTIIITDEEFDALAKRHSSRLLEFIKNMKVGYGFDVVIGYGKSTEDIISNVGIAYKQAFSALEYKFYSKDKYIISNSEMVFNFNKTNVSQYKDKEGLAEAIRKMDKASAVRQVRMMLEGLVTGGYPEVGYLKYTVSQILIGTLKNIQILIGDDQYGRELCEISVLIGDCSHFQELETNAENIILSMINDICTYRDKRGDILFEKCLEYIEKHFAEDISLEKIADEFHFNHSYFSYLFKVRTGVNFSQYLIGTRLKRGKELLDKSRKKIYEIARDVGYKDPKYFIRVFKKEFGMTPDEYRRLV